MGYFFALRIVNFRDTGIIVGAAEKYVCNYLYKNMYNTCLCNVHRSRQEESTRRKQSIQTHKTNTNTKTMCR